MKIQGSITIIGLLISFSTSAQSGWTTYKKNDSTKKVEQNGPGKVNFIEDPRINKIEQEIKYKSPLTIEGYRIQIFFSQSNDKAEEVQKEFNRSQTERAYLDYLVPNFKVMVGNFRTKLDAEKYLNKIKGLYRGAVIVPYDIRLPELK